MKIGILTFNFSVNYGAVLQCYALQEHLRACGHHVEVIDVNPSCLGMPFWRGNRFRQGVRPALRRAWLKWRHGEFLRREFDAFRRQYLRLTHKCDFPDIAEQANSFDAIVVGSDQVWGHGFHSSKVFFIGWEPTFQGRRIAYAACCGKNIVDERERVVLSGLLERFDQLSVRNSETLAFVQELSALQPPIVADPTLLYDFGNFPITGHDPCKPYILAYLLGEEIEGGHVAALRSIRARYGKLPVYVISLSESHPQHFPWADQIYHRAGVEQWVSLIANSSFVYTDSYHGILFALKYKKPFLGYYSEPWRKPRFVDLAERYQLQPHIVGSLAEAQAKQSISIDPDYSAIQATIKIHVEESHNFLRRALQ